MKILAIETSTMTGSVALIDGEEVRGEITLSVSVQHSERLMPAIGRLLEDAGMRIEEMDLFAVASGPGSFTGLRIGIAATQGLALASGKPAVGVSTLKALAMNGIFFPGLIVPVLNAYRGEIFRGIYRQNAGARFIAPLPERLEDDGVTTASDLADELKKRSGPILLLGNGVELCRPVLEPSLGNLLHVAPPIFSPRASHVAFLASKKWKEGMTEEPILPQYLRRPG